MDREVPCFLPHFSCCDRTTSAVHSGHSGGEVAQSVGSGTGLCSPPAIGNGVVAAWFLSSRISACKRSKGRIKHTVGSGTCILLSLQDG